MRYAWESYGYSADQDNCALLEVTLMSLLNREIWAGLSKPNFYCINFQPYKCVGITDGIITDAEARK